MGVHLTHPSQSHQPLPGSDKCQAQEQVAEAGHCYGPGWGWMTTGAGRSCHHSWSPGGPGRAHGSPRQRGLSQMGVVDKEPFPPHHLLQVAGAICSGTTDRSPGHCCWLQLPQCPPTSQCPQPVLTMRGQPRGHKEQAWAAQNPGTPRSCLASAGPQSHRLVFPPRLRSLAWRGHGGAASLHSRGWVLGVKKRWLRWGRGTQVSSYQPPQSYSLAEARQDILGFLSHPQCPRVYVLASS